MKKVSMKFALVLVLVVSMLSVAMAAGLLGTHVNWKGEELPEEDFRSEHVMPTLPPQALLEEAAELEWSLLNSAAPNELVVVETREDRSASGSESGIKRSVDSMDAFDALMDGVTWLPMMAFIPEGYALTEGFVEYDCRTDGAIRLSTRKTLPDGRITERYVFDENDLFVSGYHLVLHCSDEADGALVINVHLRQASDTSFGLDENQTARPIKVPGMDEALSVTAEKYCHVYMLQTLAEPVEMLDYFLNGQWMPDAYTEVMMSISAPLLDVETLTAMFAEK